MFSMFESHNLENVHVLTILTSLLWRFFFPKGWPYPKNEWWCSIGSSSNRADFWVLNFRGILPGKVFQTYFFSSKLPNVPILAKTPQELGHFGKREASPVRAAWLNPLVRGNRGSHEQGYLKNPEASDTVDGSKKSGDHHLGCTKPCK